MHNPSKGNSQLIVVNQDSPEFIEAKRLSEGFQESLDLIRDSRKNVGIKLSDLWGDWYNGIMVISFGLGGALIALLIGINFYTYTNQVFFIFGAILLLINGIYILFLRKILLEKESLALTTMCYEIEYYLMVCRNRQEDIMRGHEFHQSEYDDALKKISNNTFSVMDNLYESTKVENHMDISITLFIVSLAFIGLSAIKNPLWLALLSLLSLIGILVLLIYFRNTSNKSKVAIKTKDKWLKKINNEQRRV